MIVDKMIGELQEQLADKKVRIELTEAAREWLAERGFDPDYGARPLRRLIMQEIGDVLADEILFGQLVRGGVVQVGVEREKTAVQLRMKVIVVGPGALGCLLAAKLSREHEVWLLDHDAARAERLDKTGLLLEEEGEVTPSSIRATAAAAEIGPSDLVLLCVKSHQVAAAVRGARPALQRTSFLLALPMGWASGDSGRTLPRYLLGGGSHRPGRHLGGSRRGSA